MVIKVAWCGAQLVHSNHSHTSLGEVVPGTTKGLEGPDRLQQVRAARRPAVNHPFFETRLPAFGSPRRPASAD